MRVEQIEGAWRQGVRAGVVAGSINTGLYMLGVVSGTFSQLTLFSARAAELQLGAVLVMSIAAGVASSALFSLFRRRSQRPVRLFLMGSMFVLGASFTAPILMRQWAPAQIVLITLMHVVAAVCAINVVLRVDRSVRIGSWTRLAGLGVVVALTIH